MPFWYWTEKSSSSFSKVRDLDISNFSLNGHSPMGHQSVTMLNLVDYVSGCTFKPFVPSLTWIVATGSEPMVFMGKLRVVE